MEIILLALSETTYRKLRLTVSSIIKHDINSNEMTKPGDISFVDLVPYIVAISNITEDTELFDLFGV